MDWKCGLSGGVYLFCKHKALSSSPSLRERERDREKERERETERKREKETDREKERERMKMKERGWLQELDKVIYGFFFSFVMLGIEPKALHMPN
jgi:hypothetical protein